MSAGTNSEEHASIQATGRWSSPVARASQSLHPGGIFRGLFRAYLGGGLPHTLPFDHWLLPLAGLLSRHINGKATTTSDIAARVLQTCLQMLC